MLLLVASCCCSCKAWAQSWGTMGCMTSGLLLFAISHRDCSTPALHEPAMRFGGNSKANLPRFSVHPPWMLSHHQKTARIHVKDGLPGTRNVAVCSSDSPAWLHHCRKVCRAASVSGRGQQPAQQLGSHDPAAPRQAQVLLADPHYPLCKGSRGHPARRNIAVQCQGLLAFPESVAGLKD